MEVHAAFIEQPSPDEPSNDVHTRTANVPGKTSIETANIQVRYGITDVTRYTTQAM